MDGQMSDLSLKIALFPICMGYGMHIDLWFAKALLKCCHSRALSKRFIDSVERNSFIKNVTFQVLPDKFNVALNGQHFIEYRHRLQPLSRISHILVDGDVVLASVKCQYC